MLRHYKQRIEPQENGRFLIVTLDEIEDDPCTICGGESVYNLCEADGGRHGHGLIHNPGSNRLEARCAEHRTTLNESPIL